MTEREAIEIIKTAKADVEWNYPLDYSIAFDTAIEALEKQIPKKPINKENNYQRNVGLCPCCKEIIDDWEDYKYCGECGQAIDWREEE